METARSQNPTLPSSFTWMREALGRDAEKSISPTRTSIRIAFLPARSAPMLYGTVPTRDAKVVKDNLGGPHVAADQGGVEEEPHANSQWNDAERSRDPGIRLDSCD